MGQGLRPMAETGTQGPALTQADSHCPPQAPVTHQVTLRHAYTLGQMWHPHVCPETVQHTLKTVPYTQADVLSLTHTHTQCSSSQFIVQDLGLLGTLL